MNLLVIIPNTMHNYSFSAPLAWMFSQHVHQVKGIYGFELTRELARDYEYFIIELNWFIELKEFGLLVEFIKKNNNKAKILFGGLYASLKYQEIFKRYDVDFFIRGDNELPIKMFLESISPGKIPNFVGRNFENPIDYIFREEDYRELDFNLDWFPSYFKNIDKNQMYLLPMIITSKGGCSTVHKECDYCMGAKHKELKNIYNRPPLAMGNETLLSLLEKIEKKFSAASVQVLSRCNYDLTKQYFDIDINIEIDSPVPIEKINEILYAFKKCLLNISVYEEGLCGEAVRKNFKEILQLEDPDHQVRFYAFDREAAKLDIPQDHLLHSEDVLPGWTHWDYYLNSEQALVFSEHFYYQLEENKKFPVKNQTIDKTNLDIQFDL